MVRPVTVAVGKLHVQNDELPLGGFSSLFNSEAFLLLKSNIKRHGLLTPIFCLPPNDRGQYPVIQGHYRFWASVQLMHKEVPVVIARGHEDCLDWVDKNFGKKLCAVHLEDI